MAKPDEARLLAALEATWPAASTDTQAAPGWKIRDGAGGGKRASAALSAGSRDFEAAAAAMRARGERPLILVPDSDPELDRALAAAGWEEVDPTRLMAGPAAELSQLDGDRRIKSVHARARLALVDEIWEAGGVGTARRAVMDRCPLPKTTVVARNDTSVTGVCFVAADGDVAMLHAMEVREDMRRQGAGRSTLAGAARFALDQGAEWLALAVVDANAAAIALYESAGMETVGGYRYRRAAE
ncbi:MAG: GNAT family N-acetyltransferase [Pseudomonadota bacterium]